MYGGDDRGDRPSGRRRGAARHDRLVRLQHHAGHRRAQLGPRDRHRLEGLHPLPGARQAPRDRLEGQAVDPRRHLLEPRRRSGVARRAPHRRAAEHERAEARRHRDGGRHGGDALHRHAEHAQERLVPGDAEPVRAPAVGQRRRSRRHREGRVRRRCRRLRAPLHLGDHRPGARQRHPAHRPLRSRSASSTRRTPRSPSRTRATS